MEPATTQVLLHLILRIALRKDAMNNWLNLGAFVCLLLGVVLIILSSLSYFKKAVGEPDKDKHEFLVWPGSLLLTLGLVIFYMMNSGLD